MPETTTTTAAASIVSLDPAGTVRHVAGSAGRARHTLIVGDPGTTRDALAVRIAQATVAGQPTRLWLANRESGTGSLDLLAATGYEAMDDTAIAFLYRALDLVRQRQGARDAGRADAGGGLLLVLPDVTELLEDHVHQAAMDRLLNAGPAVGVAVLAAVDDAELTSFGHGASCWTLRNLLSEHNLYFTPMTTGAARSMTLLAAGHLHPEIPAGCALRVGVVPREFLVPIAS